MNEFVENCIGINSAIDLINFIDEIITEKWIADVVIADPFDTELGEVYYRRLHLTYAILTIV